MDSYFFLFLSKKCDDNKRESAHVSMMMNWDVKNILLWAIEQIIACHQGRRKKKIIYNIFLLPDQLEAI